MKKTDNDKKIGILNNEGTVQITIYLSFQTENTAECWKNYFLGP